MVAFTLGRTPAQSGLQPFLEGSDFSDAYEFALADPAETPAAVFARAIRSTPGWVMSALAVRDGLVRLAGIRAVGSMKRGPRAAPEVGERFGIFSVMAISDDELLLGIDDVHLDVRVSVAKYRMASGARVVITTAVRNHNWLGRLYMLPVSQIHPLVVKAMLRRL